MWKYSAMDLQISYKKINRENKTIYVMGNCNIDILKYDEQNETKKFFLMQIFKII